MQTTGLLLLALLCLAPACSQPGADADAPARPSGAAETPSAPPAPGAPALDEPSLPLATPSVAVRAPTAVDGPARARLLVPGAALVAGRTNTLALRLDLDAGWHVYWRGQNDTGLPLAAQLALPAGWSAEPPGWPAPERHESNGFVDHVYHDGATLLLPVRVPADARGPQHIALQTDWLVCADVCLPGSAALTLDVDVVAPGQRVAPREADAALMAAARARLPAALPADVSLTRAGDELLLRVPGARRLEFHPDVDGLALADIAERCAADGELLRLALEPRLAGGERLLGVLSVQRRDGAEPQHHLVDLAPPGA